MRGVFGDLDRRDARPRRIVAPVTADTPHHQIAEGRTADEVERSGSDGWLTGNERCRLASRWMREETMNIGVMSCRVWCVDRDADREVIHHRHPGDASGVEREPTIGARAGRKCSRPRISRRRLLEGYYPGTSRPRAA
jgi:hypothetical protein